MTPPDPITSALPVAARNPDRLALAITLSLFWINLATTGRWAAVPGSLRGAKWPFVAAGLGLTTLLAFRKPAADWWGAPDWLPRSVLVAGTSILAVLFVFAWFPPATWTSVPFLDDWPPRFWSTLEGARLLRRGALVGWQWNLLGGYSTASDLTQSLALPAALPMAIFGAAAGFHLLHLMLFLAVPALVFVDLRRSDSRNVAMLGAGLVALSAGGLSWSVVRTGDSNALAGLVGVLATIAASHRARTGGRHGLTALVVVLAATACLHIGFFAYAAGLLIVEAVYYREAAHVHRSAIAVLLALVISLPLTYELFRYPAWFNFNTMLYTMPAHVDWAGVARAIVDNTEILLLPHRWFNDPGGLTSLFLPLLLLAAARRDGRAGYYAWAGLFAVCLMRLNVPEAGSVFVRPVYLLLVFTPVAVAWFIATRAWSRALAIALTALTALCFQIVWMTVPHQPSVTTFLPKLVARVAASSSPLVLVENNPDRNVVASTLGSNEPSYYGTHYEALLPEATGQRLYAGAWDGWQRTPFRGEMLAGGAWKGHLLNSADHNAFVAEMRKWGVRDLFVWSANANKVIGRWPEFIERWSDEPWRQFELTATGADARSVATDHGQGELLATNPLGGLVRLHDVAAGDRVIVRTHFHPSWQAEARGRPIQVLNRDGQLAFIAPADGSYDVTFVYPARRWLLLLSLAVVLATAAFEWRFGRRGLRT